MKRAKKRKAPMSQHPHALFSYHSPFPFTLSLFSPKIGKTKATKRIGEQHPHVPPSPSTHPAKTRGTRIKIDQVCGA
jgi:hypothetical protein